MNNIYIENGWTFAQVEFNGKKYELSNSNMFDNDVLEKLLTIILKFILNDIGREYVIWNQESQYYIIEYILMDGEITTKLYCSCRPYYDGINWKNDEMKFVENERRNLWEWVEEMFFGIYEYYENRNKEEYFSEKTIELITKIKRYFKI